MRLAKRTEREDIKNGEGKSHVIKCRRCPFRFNKANDSTRLCDKEKGDISPANAQHRVTMLHAILLYCVLLLSTVHAQPGKLSSS